MENKSLVTQSKDEMVIYQTEDGTIKIDVLFDQETVWLSADQMGQLFGKAEIERRLSLKPIGLSKITLKKCKQDSCFGTGLAVLVVSGS